MREGSRLRVLLIEPRALLAESLAAGLREQGMTAVDVLSGEVTTAELVTQLTEARPDVAVVGRREGDGVEAHALIATLVAADTRVLVLTSGEDPGQLVSSLEAGASGVFTTRQPLVELAGYIVDAARGATLLSPLARGELLAMLNDRVHDAALTTQLFHALTTSEEAVLGDLMQGHAPDQIARERFVAVSTVRSQIRSILAKLGVSSQLAAVTLAFRSGWPEMRQLA